MAMKLYLLLALLVAVNHGQAQFLLTKVCTLDARSSLAIQQVDDDWNPVPFDCENTHILIESDTLTVEHSPGKYDHCPAIWYRNSLHSDRLTEPVFVLYENPGTYQVTVSRFDEINTFKNVVIPVGEDGCHVEQQILEVQFDLTQRAKK